MFGFIWLGTKSDKERGIDRIKRSVLKNAYSEGGLNVTDVDCLNRSLKLRQFLRASKSCHPVNKIQQFCLERLGYSTQIMQEYSRISAKDGIIQSAQCTLNNLCDFFRKTIIENIDETREESLVKSFIGKTDISEYLLRKKKRMINCMYLPLKREGTDKLFELCTEAKIKSDQNRIIWTGNVISAFPLELIEIASACDENQLNSNQNWSHKD